MARKNASRFGSSKKKTSRATWKWATKLAATYVDEVYRKWEIDRESEDLAWKMDGNFGWRFGYSLSHDLFEDWLASSSPRSAAIAARVLQSDIDLAEGIADKALKQFKKNRLPEGSYGLSLELVAAALRAHIEAGSTAAALHYAYQLGRLMEKEVMRPHEPDANRGKKVMDGLKRSGKMRKLSESDEPAVVKAVLKAQSSSPGRSWTAVCQDIAEDFKVSRPTISRVMKKHGYSSKTQPKKSRS